MIDLIFFIVIVCLIYVIIFLKHYSEYLDRCAGSYLLFMNQTSVSGDWRGGARTKAKKQSRDLIWPNVSQRLFFFLPLCGAPTVKSPVSRACIYELLCISMATVPVISPKQLTTHQPAGESEKMFESGIEYIYIYIYIINNNLLLQISNTIFLDFNVHKDNL